MHVNLYVSKYKYKTNIFACIDIYVNREINNVYIYIYAYRKNNVDIHTYIALQYITLHYITLPPFHTYMT